MGDCLELKGIRTKINKLLKNLRAKGFFHIFGGSIINKIITFMSSVVLVHILTKGEYGIFTYAWNIYSIVLLFNGMGVVIGSLQLMSEHSSDADYILNTSRYATKFGCRFDILLGIVIVFLGLVAPLKIEEGRVILTSLFALPLLQFLYSMAVTILRASKRNREFAKLSVLNTICVFLFSVVLAWFFKEIGLVIAYYIAFLISIIVAKIKLNIKFFGPDDRILSVTEKKDFLRISVVSMINDGLSQLLFLLDVFIIGIVDPQETLIASYKVATMIPTALIFIPSSLIVFIYPYFAEHRNDGKWCISKYKQVLLGMGGVNLCISFLLFIASPLIIRIVYGEQYLDAVPVFRVLAINYFFSGTFRMLSGNLLITQRKLKFNLMITIIASIVNAIADYFFISWWGSMGAAYATFLVVMIISITCTIYLIISFKQNTIRIQEN